MAEPLVVLMDGVPAASITRGTGGLLRLEYDRGYARRADATPISLSMPFAQAVHADTRARSHDRL